MRLPKRWDCESYLEFQKELALLEDRTYKEFNFKLIFTNYEKIGIRLPILREMAKKISKNNPYSFLEVVEDVYYEEVLLTGLVISMLQDVEKVIFYLEQYIEKIDNWALCDYVIDNMKIINQYKKLFLKKIKKYVKTKDEYRVRVGLFMLLDYYVEDDYLNQIFKICNRIKLDTYYVNMAISLVVSECFLKDKKKTIEFLKKNKLNTFTQNKTISKIQKLKQVNDNDKLFVLSFKR